MKNWHVFSESVYYKNIIIVLLKKHVKFLLQSCKGAKKPDNSPNRIEWNGIRISAQIIFKMRFYSSISGKE